MGGTADGRRRNGTGREETGRQGRQASMALGSYKAGKVHTIVRITPPLLHSNEYFHIFMLLLLSSGSFFQYEWVCNHVYAHTSCFFTTGFEYLPDYPLLRYGKPDARQRYDHDLDSSNLPTWVTASGVYVSVNSRYSHRSDLWYRCSLPPPLALGRPSLPGSLALWYVRLSAHRTDICSTD